jgi:dTDP-4-dehydrorhamnose reductase
MRIVVTGTKGQVAQALVSAGGESEIIAVGRPSLDLTDPESVRRALIIAEPDVVVNAAAYTTVDRAESEREQVFRINADGAGAVAEAAREMQVPVIQLSTDYVYDGTKTEPYVEDDPVAPCNVYGASKLAGEGAVLAATPNHVILRTAWVYSPVGKNFVRTMLRFAQTNEEVRVVADQLGCPTSAREIARSIVSVAQRVRHDSSPSLRGIYHLAGSGETTWADFADTIFCQIERKWKRRPAVRRISTQEFPTPARRPQNSRLNCEKVKRHYGLNIPDWQESLRVCLEEIDDAAKP